MKNHHHPKEKGWHLWYRSLFPSPESRRQYCPQLLWLVSVLLSTAGRTNISCFFRLFCPLAVPSSLPQSPHPTCYLHCLLLSVVLLVTPHPHEIANAFPWQEAKPLNNLVTWKLCFSQSVVKNPDPYTYRPYSTFCSPNGSARDHAGSN